MKYTVKLIKKETCYEGGNQWSGPEKVFYKTTTHGEYNFNNKPDAINHLNGFLKSRPQNEIWEKTHDHDGTCDGILLEYTHQQTTDVVYYARIYQVNNNEHIKKAIELLENNGYCVVNTKIEKYV